MRRASPVTKNSFVALCTSFALIAGMGSGRLLVEEMHLKLKALDKNLGQFSSGWTRPVWVTKWS